MRRSAALLAPLVLCLAFRCPSGPPAGTCEDPLVGLPPLPALAQEALSAACPVCPVIEQARYADHFEYVACVSQAAADARDAGLLNRGLSLVAVGAALASDVATGEPASTLLPGPGENGHDPALADLAQLYDRQFASLNAAPFGMSLDVHAADAGARQAMADFLADPAGGSGPAAFEAHSGIPVFDAVDRFGEVGDLGMFGGVAAAGDAFRYALLRERCAQQGIDCAAAAAARATVLQILEALHVAHAITGPNGVIVRGLATTDMPIFESPDPDIWPPSEVVDAMGDATPACSQKPENPTFAGFSQRLRFRLDASPTSEFAADWIWMDNASKDQLTGWVFAMGALYDVVHGDPDVPQALVDRLAADAATMGMRLMREVNVTGTPLDMTILDGDGCATTFHDLNAEEFEGLAITFVTDILLFLGGDDIPPETQVKLAAFRNGFNALLGLAAMRTFCHISADPDVCAFYYDDLIGTRGWDQLLLQDPIPIADLPEPVLTFLEISGLPIPPTLSELGSLAIDFAEQTNYSNVNMGFVGFYGLLRYEPDPVLRATYTEALETALWDTGANARQPDVLHQSFFDFIFAGLCDGPGLCAAGTPLDVLPGAAQTLHEFPVPPYFNPSVENCDAAEELAGLCTAVDGVTPIPLSPFEGRNGALVAEDPLPKRLRPPSNFEWRSGPYEVNGGGGDRLNPGGDFRAAYWMGRFLRRTENGGSNLAANSVGPPAP